MINVLIIVSLLLSGILGAEECDECCVPNIGKLTDTDDVCFKDCMNTCLMEPTVNLESAAVSILESGDAEICVVRSGSTDGTASVTLNSVDGTATSGIDFIAVTQTDVSFVSGSARECITVSIVDDLLTDGDETFSIKITAVTNATIGSWDSTVVTITDNEST